MDEFRQYLTDVPRAVRRLKFANVIGRGSFGVVFTAFDPDCGRDVAVKIVSRRLLEEASVLAAFERELRVHETLHHPNIVEIYQIAYGSCFIYMVMELCSGGDLLDYIQNHEFRSSTQTLSIFQQVLSAVAYLHARGIAHLDIKPDNILLGENDQAKLADFGCCQAPPKGRDRQTIGTLVYAAPEMLTAERIDNRPADIWSLGLLFFTLETGALPFFPGDEASLRRQIMSGTLQFNLLLPNYVMDIVERCCVLNADSRPTADALVAMAVFKPNAPRTTPTGGTLPKSTSAESGKPVARHRIGRSERRSPLPASMSIGFLGRFRPRGLIGSGSGQKIRAAGSTTAMSADLPSQSCG
jgi:serine/threonine protein kinase